MRLERYQGNLIKEINILDIPNKNVQTFYSKNRNKLWLWKDLEGHIYEFNTRYPQQDGLVYIFKSIDDLIDLYN